MHDFREPHQAPITQAGPLEQGLERAVLTLMAELHARRIERDRVLWKLRRRREDELGLGIDEPHRVAGFGEQLINALYPAAPGAAPTDAPQPGPRLYYPPTRPDFQKLKNRLEREWLPEMCRVLSIDPAELTVIWDADFMYGLKDAAGDDTYVLCEINISEVHPFPDEALVPLAEETLRRAHARRLSR